MVPDVYVTDLLMDDEQISRERVSRLMKKEALASKHTKKFKVTTDSNHDQPIAPNLLQRQFDVKQPNRAYVTDMTLREVILNYFVV